MPNTSDPRAGGAPGDTLAGQVAALVEQIPVIAAELRAANTREIMQTALAPILGMPNDVQEALAQAIGRLRGDQGLDALDVVEAWSELGNQRAATKEARRASIRLESAGLRSRIKVPAARAVAATVPNELQFAGAWATRSRESSEVAILIAWSRGEEWQGYRISFIFWKGEILIETTPSGLTQRRFEREQIEEMRTSFEVPVVALTLGQVRFLFEDLLDQMAWRGTTLATDVKSLLDLLKGRIQRDEEHQGQAADASVMTLLIDADIEADEVMVDFWSAWAFGDFMLCYELLAERASLRQGATRDEFIALRRKWYDEALPARLRIGATAKTTAEQSGLWVPDASMGTNRSNWAFFWSLEMRETPIAGQLSEVPMATLTNPSNQRRWFWQTISLERDAVSKRWRITRIRDEGAAAQARPVEDLIKRSNELWDEADALAQQFERTGTEAQNREHVLHIMALVQESQSLGEAALMRLPGDRELHKTLVEHAQAVRLLDRAAALLERIITHFGATMDLWLQVAAIQFNQAQVLAEQEDASGHHFWLDTAIASARQAIAIERTPEGLVVLGELLNMHGDSAEAESLLRESLAIRETSGAWIDLGDLLMRQRQFIPAISAFEQAQRLDPTTAVPRWRLGRALEMVDRKPEARLAYEDAVEQNPEDGMAQMLLGVLLATEHEYDQAYLHLIKALELGVMETDLFLQLAVIEADRGNTNSALQLLDQAVRLSPQLAPQIKQMAETLRAQPRNKPR